MALVCTFCFTSAPYSTGNGNNSEKRRQTKVKAYSGRQANDCPDTGCFKPDTTRHFLSIKQTLVLGSISPSDKYWICDCSQKEELAFFRIFWWHWLNWVLTAPYNDNWCSGACQNCIVAIQVGMHGVWHDPGMWCMSWILNKGKHETKGRRDGCSDGLGNTELLSHWAMAGNQQHVGSVICDVDENCGAWSDHVSVKLSLLLKPSKISSSSLSLRGPCNHGIVSPINDQMVSIWCCKEHQSFLLHRGRLVFLCFLCYL